MPSPFATAFRTYELSFVTGDGALVEDPDTGLVRPEPGSNTATILATLQAAGDVDIRAQLGADAQEVALIGRCVEPMQLPEGVRDGMTSSLTYQGTPGAFELRIAAPDLIPAVERALGERMTGVWRAQRS